MGEFFLGMMEITIGMSILILLMLFTLKLIGGKFTAKCRYILWTLVLIRLAVPISFGILPALIEVPVETESVQQIQIPTVNYTPTQQNPITVQPQEQVQIPTPTVPTPVFTEPEPDPLTWEDVKAYIPHAYLAGAAVFLLWNLLAYGIYTAKILRSPREADAKTQAIYEAVCRKKGLHRMPKLLVSLAVNSPAAFGLLFRRIVLPDIALTENGLTGTLSHEVTHCKRGDLWIKAVCLLARSLHWFNPLVHLAAFRCEMEMELSCDEAVLAGCDENTRAAYGEVMLDIIKRCRQNRGALTTHFNPKKNAVKARFANILYGSGEKRGLWLIAVCLVLCLIAGAIVACRTETEPEEEVREENTEIPEESLSEDLDSGTYPTVEAYINERMAQESTITYYSVSRHHAYPDRGADEWTAIANVVDTKLVMFEKKGELDGLASDGVLECWEYRYHLKLDVPTDDVMTVDGDFEGWFDMVGQHTVVALRYSNGTYSILMDEMTGDGIDFGGYHDTYEEAIYDWYVTEYGLDLPLYVEDWTDQITTPNGEYIGNHPVHRFDGDGWGIYLPVAAWYQSTDTEENQWLWCSSYLNGSALLVEEFSHYLEDEYVTAEKQGYTPTDRTNRVWEDHTDGTHSYYYYYENPNGGFWRVTIEWTDSGVSSENPNVVIESQILKLMAKKFVVFGTGNHADNAVTVISQIYLCDDVYLSNTTPSHGESTIIFPNGLNGYKLYNCDVVLCTDDCAPENVVWRKFNGYAGGFPLNELEPTQTGKYPTKLYKVTYPEEELAQILTSMEQQGASEQQKQEYRNKRWYLYLLTVDEEHYACIFIEPEDVLALPENEQEILDELIASVEITYTYIETAEEVNIPVEEIIVEEVVEEIVQFEEPSSDWLVDEDSEPYTYTREEWIQYSLYTDFGFREPVDVSALTDDELTAYMADAYQCALDIYFLFHVSSDRMYARNVWSTTMPDVVIDGRHYSQMFNPVFPTLADLESYMNGVLSHDLTKELLAMGMFIDYEGELWGMMGARGTDISKKTIGFTVTSRTDTEIIYTAEVEVREHDLGSEEPDYVECYDFTYSLTEDGWRWTDFYLYN